MRTFLLIDYTTDMNKKILLFCCLGLMYYIAGAQFDEQWLQLNGTFRYFSVSQFSGKDSLRAQTQYIGKMNKYEKLESVNANALWGNLRWSKNYSYDRKGRLLWVKDEKDRKLYSYGYDGEGRVTEYATFRAGEYLNVWTHTYEPRKKTTNLFKGPERKPFSRLETYTDKQERAVRVMDTRIFGETTTTYEQQFRYEVAGEDSVVLEFIKNDDSLRLKTQSVYNRKTGQPVYTADYVRKDRIDTTTYRQSDSLGFYIEKKWERNKLVQLSIYRRINKELRLPVMLWVPKQKLSFEYDDKLRTQKVAMAKHTEVGLVKDVFEFTYE